MSKTFGKFWYALNFGSTNSLVMLTYADSIGEATEIFGLLAGKDNVKVLKWSELSELTGCPIPNFVRASNFARGNFIFTNSNCRVVFWQDIRESN